jgi:hypothetical protein
MPQAQRDEPEDAGGEVWEVNFRGDEELQNGHFKILFEQ